MKNRFLVAGLMVLGVTACGDDLSIQQPPPPLPPPLTASMAPASATVAIGGNVVFAVNASGGAAGEAASWTCASSNTGIATASNASAGCQATGVAAGGVTITAAVTKGGATVNVGAQLTVTEEDTGEPAFLILASITDASDNDNDALSGRVSAVLNVERGDQTFEELSLLVDGAMVASQSFGTVAMTPPDDDAAEQAVHSFTLSFNSNGYDPGTGAPDYMNGEHTVAAQLTIAGSAEPISSNIVPVEFNNDDGVFVTLDGLGAGAMKMVTGQVWYGGPAVEIAITAVPVMYSGGSAASVGIGAFCGDEAAAATGPFVFTPECEGTGEHSATFTADGADIDVLNGDVFPLSLDFDGPAAPIFSPNPNGREDGWVNATVDFLGAQGSRNEDGWLTYNDDDEAGVGGYQPVLRYAEGNDIEDAIAASPSSTLTGESEADAYCVVASAVDLLGNESGLPDEDDGSCNTVANYETLLTTLATADSTNIADAQAALADAGLLAGVDLTPPGIELADDKNRFNTGDPSLAFDAYDDEHEDSNSDLHSLPLLVSAQIRDTNDTDCLDIAADGAVGTTSDDCDDPTALGDGTAVAFTSPANAYYTVQGVALDKAGNYSTPRSHTFVFDGEVATATAPAAPRIDAGEAFHVASFLNDDLSIRDYYVTANFPASGTLTAVRLGVVTPTVVDAFDADPLTYRNQTVSATVDTYTGLQEDAAATDVTTLTGVSVAVRDQADSDGMDDGTPGTTTIAVADAGEVDDGFDSGEDPFTVAFESSDDVCVAEDLDGCAAADPETETELEVVATATNEGAFSDPFDRVDFWVEDVNGASWLIGSDTSGSSGRVSSSDRHRTWTYSLDVSAAALYMATREAAFLPSTDSDDHTVRAFGVNDDGIALVSEETIKIDDGEGGN